MNKRVFAELLGTFTLVFCLTSTIVTSGGGIIAVALALGLTVMVMIYALGRVSGAHFNPAVTLAMVLAGRMPLKDAVPYWIAQCIGAVLASLLLWTLIPHTESAWPYVQALGLTAPGGTWDRADLQALAMEVVLTFFLVLVVLRVADGPKEMSLLAGIAVGGVLAMCVFVGGNVSGASMNPARSLGPALVLMKFNDFWIYIVGPLAGAAHAVAANRMLERAQPRAA
jgi:aquaporin NIP